MPRLVWFWLFAFTSPVAGQVIHFRTHEINQNSEFPAAAVIDVNKDGRPDIVSGGFWYEGPRWNRHFLREVEVIRGRFDDYSNLPLDVNGDGNLDLVSANYRSKSLFWIENPGKVGATWNKHTIDVPGPMETGRLEDVDGDGQVDILPNGTDFAAWWELIRGSEGGTSSVRWMRHDLPQEIAGHGLGIGDLNQDGRRDLIGRSGWLEAPVDRRKGRWIWHPDFYLDRDASIPIVVHDVDGDGDADLIWGRGHSVGLYWLEQSKSASGSPIWTRHAIDTSWSQPHSLLLADLDGDKSPELIAGKRYMGHDGKDVGEYDPLVVYWYSFVSKLRTFRRGTISEHPRAGLGLDPKAVDVDGDGDIDIVAPDRSGLYWFENQGNTSASTVAWSRPVEYPNHTDIMVYRDDDESIKKVDSPDTWAKRRSHILQSMQAVMGPMPPPVQRVPLDVQIVDETETPKYIRRTVTFASEPGDRVPAYLLIPRGLTEKVPAVLCLHQTTKIGKGEPAGLGGLKTLHYAHELAERGYVCLVPDYPSFGDYAYDFKSKGAHYRSGSMKAIWNNIRAVDLLESLPEVARDQIGVMGHSLGGHNSLFTAAFDLRLKAVATSCGFTAFHHYYEGKLAGWTSDRYMPVIRDEFQNNPDKVPFDFYEVLGAIAPRAIYVNAPLNDSNFEKTGVRKVMDSVAELYKLLESDSQLVGTFPDVGHEFPDSIRQDCYQHFDKWLKK